MFRLQQPVFGDASLTVTVIPIDCPRRVRCGIYSDGDDFGGQAVEWVRYPIMFGKVFIDSRV